MHRVVDKSACTCSPGFCNADLRKGLLWLGVSASEASRRSDFKLWPGWSCAERPAREGWPCLCTSQVARHGPQPPALLETWAQKATWSTALYNVEDGPCSGPFKASRVLSSNHFRWPSIEHSDHQLAICTGRPDKPSAICNAYSMNNLTNSSRPLNHRLHSDLCRQRPLLSPLLAADDL